MEGFLIFIIIISVIVKIFSSVAKNDDKQQQKQRPVSRPSPTAKPVVGLIYKELAAKLNLAVRGSGQGIVTISGKVDGKDLLIRFIPSKNYSSVLMKVIIQCIPSFHFLLVASDVGSQLDSFRQHLNVNQLIPFFRVHEKNRDRVKEFFSRSDLLKSLFIGRGFAVKNIKVNEDGVRLETRIKLGEVSVNGMAKVIALVADLAAFAVKPRETKKNTLLPEKKQEPVIIVNAETDQLNKIKAGSGAKKTTLSIPVAAPVTGMGEGIKLDDNQMGGSPKENEADVSLKTIAVGANQIPHTESVSFQLNMEPSIKDEYQKLLKKCDRNKISVKEFAAAIVKNGPEWIKETVDQLKEFSTRPLIKETLYILGEKAIPGMIPYLSDFTYKNMLEDIVIKSKDSMTGAFLEQLAEIKEHSHLEGVLYLIGILKPANAVDKIEPFLSHESYTVRSRAGLTLRNLGLSSAQIARMESSVVELKSTPISHGGGEL